MILLMIVIIALIISRNDSYRDNDMIDDKNNNNNGNDNYNAGSIKLIYIYGKQMHRLIEYLYTWTGEQAIDDYDDDTKKSADDNLDM